MAPRPGGKDYAGEARNRGGPEEVDISRGHRWFILVAVLVVVLAVASAARLPEPFARPAPNPKWANITEEPVLNVYMSDTGAVERMKFEDYIEGVVAAEMDPDWPLEALKAQAIVARTFTLDQLQRTGGVADRRPGADVSTDPDEFQAFDASRVNENVRRAVRETRGLVITYRGWPVRAWFHSDAGGVTAEPREGLGSQAADAGTLPYLRCVAVPWTAPDTEWTASFTKEEVRRAAAEVGRDPGDFTSVAIGKKGPSGRALEISLGGTAVPAPEFRLALDPRRMKSTLLTSLRLEGGRVVMTGRGNGHGVGLSQHAARAMASQGQKAEDIIRFFFRGVDIKKMWP